MRYKLIAWYIDGRTRCLYKARTISPLIKKGNSIDSPFQFCGVYALTIEEYDLNETNDCFIKDRFPVAIKAFYLSNVPERFETNPLLMRLVYLD